MTQDAKTLYIKNLNERIGHHRINKELQAICSEFGKVLAVYTNKGIRKRGQAFIAFETPIDAKRAFNGLKNRSLFEKAMHVAYSHLPSNTFADANAAKVKNRVRDGEDGSSVSANKRHKASDPKEDLSDDVHTEQLKDRPKIDFGIPNNTILLQQIPDEVSLELLQTYCSEFAGFKEARMFAIRHVGFVEFESVEAAEAAIDIINQQNLGNAKYALK